MMERKSSEVLAKGRQVDELRRPENSPKPFPLACYMQENAVMLLDTKEKEIKEGWMGKRMV